MNSVALLTSRNLRLFFRDRAGVFFSLLSALILIALYALFLGNLQVENLQAELPRATTHDINWFVNTWVFAGITMMTTLTTALAALSVFVEDNASGRFRDFLVAPVRRVELILGYFFASFIISLLMSVFIAIVGQLYLLTQGDGIMRVNEIAQSFGWITLSSATYAAIASFIVTLLESSGAFAALSTVVGTIIGFLAGAYIPAGTLPDGLVKVLNALPFAQSAMLIRRPFTARAVDSLTARSHHELAAAAIEKYYGVSATIGHLTVTPAIAATELGIVLVVFAALGAWRLSRKIR
jgi:multidrug/hemolysin transport system permease protein